MTQLSNQDTLRELREKVLDKGAVIIDTVISIEQDDLLGLLDSAKVEVLKQMLQDAKDNEDAGHKWSRADFIKWAEAELEKQG